MTGLTAAIGEFLANIRYNDLPSECLPLVRDAFVDTAAVIMVGANQPGTRIVYSQTQAAGGSGKSRICLSDQTGPANACALVSGASAHAIDYDDQSLTGHPSAVLVPAILAEADALGSSGKDMATAYVAGYEVWAEIIRRNRNYHVKGWHPTSVFGVIGAAASVAVLRRLDAAKAQTALAIAASYASGLSANFGSMTKPLHAGIAASNGVFSAQLAAAGMTAGKETLESPRGYLTAYSPDGETPDRTSPSRLGLDWYLPVQRLCVKKFPTCYFMHRSFEATVALLKDQGIGPNDIARIDVTMGRGQTVVLANERPQNADAARFSEQFAIAAAVILGSMGVKDVTDEVVSRPDIQAFFHKVHLIPEDSSDPRDPAHSPTESVRIELTSGKVLESGPVHSIRGHAEDPLSDEELWQKFRECTADTHSEAEAQTLHDCLKRVDALKSVSDIPTTVGLFSV